MRWMAEAMMPIKCWRFCGGESNNRGGFGEFINPVLSVAVKEMGPGLAILDKKRVKGKFNQYIVIKA